MSADGWKALFWGGGCIGRKAYAITMLTLVVLGWLSHLLGVAAAYAMPWMMKFIAGPMLILDFAVAWMTICLCSRRLHDAGHTAWWQAPPSLAVVACLALAEPAFATALGFDEVAAEWAALLGLALYVAMLVVIGLLPPAPGRDRFNSVGTVST